MRRSRTRSSLKHSLTGLSASVVLVAAVTGVMELVKSHISPIHLLVLYTLAVLPIAVVWGTGLAAVTAVLSVAVYGFMFVQPTYTFSVTDWRDTVALAVFLVTAVVVGQLADRLRRAAVLSGRMSQEQSALRRVATLVAQSAAPRELFEAVTREVGLLCGADLARMERYEPDGTVTGVAAWSKVPARLSIGDRFGLEGLSIAREVRRTGGPARVDSFAGAAGQIAEEARALGIHFSVGCPIVVAGNLWGVIAASRRSEEPFPANTEVQLGSFTELVATAIENAEARAELRESRTRIITAADQTRRRIERDLHDGAQQRLVALVLRLRAAQAAVPPESDDLFTQLGDAITELNNALDDLREMSRGIHPAILTEGGLIPALKALARRSPVPVELDVAVQRDLPEQVEVNAYYVISEALTNGAKHAHASTIAITVNADGDALRLTVRDDGVGGADLTRGTGLIGLEDRVVAHGGRIRLHSPPGHGTTIEAELPLTSADVAEPAATPSPRRAHGERTGHEAAKASQPE